MNSLKDLFIFLNRCIKENPTIIETGVQHWFKPGNLDYYSTLNLIQFIVKPKHGMLYTFDIENQHIIKCKLKVAELNYTGYIQFILGDSIEQLKKLQIPDKIDLVFLDSKEYDEEHMLNEFKILEPLLSDNCIIMCDDATNVGSTKCNKAVPYIKEKVDLWFYYNTPTGLFVGIRNEKIC